MFDVVAELAERQVLMSGYLKSPLKIIVGRNDKEALILETFLKIIFYLIKLG